VVVVVLGLVDRLGDLAENVLRFNVVLFGSLRTDLVDRCLDLRVVPKLVAHLLWVVGLVASLQDSCRAVKVVGGIEISLDKEPLLGAQFVQWICHRFRVALLVRGL
jgi:hypothetical protein